MDLRLEARFDVIRRDDDDDDDDDDGSTAGTAVIGVEVILGDSAAGDLKAERGLDGEARLPANATT